MVFSAVRVGTAMAFRRVDAVRPRLHHLVDHLCLRLIILLPGAQAQSSARTQTHLILLELGMQVPVIRLPLRLQAQERRLQRLPIRQQLRHSMAPRPLCRVPIDPIYLLKCLPI